MAKLAPYRAKRDFRTTTEPPGQEAEAGGNAFVIQKHDASRMHYDLRLELDGVMKSWAVAKGPSLVPGDKRLAIHTEDHPIEYNAFEGTIPKGEYGGGTVLIWDRGSWEPEYDPHKGYKKGHLQFRLTGEKLGGSWHLVRMRKKAGEKQEPWLLIKAEDDHAREAGDPDVLDAMPLSVVSGRSLEQIAAAPDGAVWRSNWEEPAPPEKPTPRGRRKSQAAVPAPNEAVAVARLTADAAKGVMPRAIEPCLATLATAPPRGERWVHEIKWDGYRLLAFKTTSGVRLATRRGLDWTYRFPRIAEAVGALGVETAILDGEAVIPGPNGAADFSALQNALSDEHGKIAREAVLYAFDLLHVAGHDLRPLPLDKRKARLALLVPAAADGGLRLSEHLDTDGEAMLRSAAELGLEGIVSKRRDRPYRSGRSDDWLKIKFADSQDFVIAGYVPSAAARQAIGSLMLGYYEGSELRPAGRTGTGFTAQSSRALFRTLEPLRRRLSPFRQRLTADERRGVAWVEPTLVAEVEFRGWTGDDRLRHAAFKGLREDKTPTEVVREGGPVSGRPVPSAAAPRRAGGRTAEGAVAGVRLTHPERVLWTEGTTKQDLADYYLQVADWLLPHVAGRPLSLVRCPNGAEAGCFFQKHSWAGLSEHIQRRTVSDPDGGEEEVLFVRDIPGVIGLVQASVLEIHPWGARIENVELPDRITIDLDPGEGVAWPAVIAAAREVRERLRAAKLESFVKTTGGKGLHVVVPLTGRTGWDAVKGFAKSLSDAMEADAPDRYIAKATKKVRGGLIYVDYLRNGRGATAIAAYSSRARPGATVSVPLSWEELGRQRAPNGFTVSDLPFRLRRLKADPWAGIDDCRQTVPATSYVRRRTQR